MTRIGLFGGTFNPIHIGHLAVAQTARETMKLDKVIFIPSNWPPHKNTDTLALAKHRFGMVRLAIKDNPHFAISDFEIRRQEKSYTIDTLKHFCRVLPRDSKLFFIIGGDTLAHLKDWRYIDDILKIVTFIVANRPGQFKKNLGMKIRYHAITMQGIDISSSYVRQRIAQGKTAKYYVQDSILGYIKRHHLYQKS